MPEGPLSQIHTQIEPDFPYLVDETAEPRLGMNIKLVSEKSFNICSFRKGQCKQKQQ